MSLSSVNNRITATGNGAVDTYPYTFRIFDQSDLLVTVRNTSDVETTLVITTDYTVTGVGANGGGNVVLVNSGQAWLDGDGDLLTGYVLSIRRVVDLTQLTDIRNQGDFYPEIHEDQFDKLTMVDQQQQDEIDRSMKLSETTDPADFNTELPSSIIGQPFVTIQTNAAGDGFEEGPTASEIENAESYAIAADASADAASASAVSAAASLAAIQAAIPYRDVVYLTSASSPVTLVAADAGKIYHCDCTGGAILINLPSIALVTSTPKMFGFVKTDSSANKVTLDANGTDTVEGDATFLLEGQSQGASLIADTDASPDDWTVLNFGSSGSVGGGGSLKWIEVAGSPVIEVEYEMEVYKFENGAGNVIAADVRVPSGFLGGRPIKLKVPYYTPDTSGTVHLIVYATLYSSGSVMSSPINVHFSVNTAVTLSGSANTLRFVEIDLSSSTGTLNSVAAVAGDIVRIRFLRNTDTATSDVRVLLNSAEVTFV